MADSCSMASGHPASVGRRVKDLLALSQFVHFRNFRKDLRIGHLEFGGDLRFYANPRIGLPEPMEDFLFSVFAYWSDCLTSVSLVKLGGRLNPCVRCG